MREAANILAGPSPRQEDIRRLQRPSDWNVAQQIARKPRPLADVVQDLKCKVLEAARKLQKQLNDSRPSVSGSAEQLASASSLPDSDLRMSSAELPDASMGVPKTFDINDFELACKRDGAFCREQAKLRRLAEKPKTRSAEAFALLQDCSKYYKQNWIVDDDQKQMEKLLEQLEIVSQPHLTSKMCRRLFKLTDVGELLGPFVQRNSQGHQGEHDHEEVRAVAFDTNTMRGPARPFARRGVPLLSIFLRVSSKQFSCTLWSCCESPMEDVAAGCARVL